MVNGKIQQVAVIGAGAACAQALTQARHVSVAPVLPRWALTGIANNSTGAQEAPHQTVGHLLA